MLVAIDPSIADSQHLATGVLEGATVLFLDPERDGIVQISEYLHRHRGFTSLHLICHGAPGSLYLGQTKLELDNLNTYQNLFSQWRDAFCKGEILLYGCQIAKGEKGRAFVRTLGEMTGVAIAASADLTGNATLGGTWALEYQTGAIATLLAFKTDVMASYSSVLAVFNVSDVNQLIQSIKDANANQEADTINLAANTIFELTQAEQVDPFYGATGLPVILDNTTINGNGATIQRAGNAPNFRLFLIAGAGSVGFGNSTAMLTLDNVTLKGGRVGPGLNASDDGGGVFNSGGDLIVRNSTITENYAEDDGGGILSTGTGQGLARTIIENSTISNNITRGDALDDGGAGIDNDGNKDSNALGAQMTIENSIITGNNSQNGSGGGIRNVNGGVLTIRNSEVSNNSSQFGSGIANGADIGVSGTRLTIGNTKIENNSGGGLDVQDAFDADGVTGPTTVVNDGGNTITTTNAPELLTSPPSIRVSIDPNGSTIVDGQPTPIAFGEIIQNTPQTFTTFKVENLGQDPLNLNPPILVGPAANAFILDNQGFQTTLGENQSTTFKVALKTDTLGTFDAGINFGVTGDPTVTGPFDFGLRGIVATPPPEIRVSIDPDGTPVLDNAPTAIALGNTLFGGVQPFTTFKIENVGVRDLIIDTPPVLQGGPSSPFILDLAGFNGTLPPNQSTTFKVSLKTDRVGQFDEEIIFNTNDPQITGPFNIKLSGAIDPTLLVELVDEQDRVIRAIADGSPVPVNLGDLLPDTQAQPAKVRITNKGTQAIDLGTPAIAGGNANAFTLDTMGFQTNLGANQSTSFAIALNAPDPGTFNGTVEFTTTDTSVTAPPFDFAIRGSRQPEVVTPPPPPPPPLGQEPNRLAFDRGGKRFAIGSEGGNALELQLTGESASEFLQIGISFQNPNGSFGNPQPLFAPLPGRFRPNGFNVSTQRFLRPNLNPGQQFRIILQNVDGGTLSTEPEVVETASGEYSLRFARGVALNVRQTVAGPPRGIGTLQGQGKEVFDLREISGSVRSNFTVYREAAFDNTVGFYAIDDTNGTVGGLAPGSAGYALAAIENRVSGLDLAVANQGTAGFSADLSGGKIYAPFIIIDGTVDEFLNDNPNNSADGDVVAFFLYQEANFDNTDHIRLLGQNTFGFEDLRDGGDFDFNDVIAVADIA